MKKALLLALTLTTTLISGSVLAEDEGDCPGAPRKAVPTQSRTHSGMTIPPYALNVPATPDRPAAVARECPGAPIADRAGPARDSGNAARRLF